MIIKVLNDNLSSNEKFKCEHGLSLYIEHNEFKFLFDAGQTDLFIQNACLLGVILNDIDFIVLSHGDYDHGNGLKYLDIGKRDLYAHPHFLEYRISKRTGLFDGLNQSREQINDRFNLIESDKPIEIRKDIFFMGEIKRLSHFDIGGLPMVDRFNKEYMHLDDTGIAIKTDKGVIVITGCAHSGLCNIIEHAKTVSGCNEVYAVIGGFHLKDTGKKTQNVLKYLKKVKPKKLFLAHCTSEDAKTLLINELDSETYRLKTGLTYEL